MGERILYDGDLDSPDEPKPYKSYGVAVGEVRDRASQISQNNTGKWRTLYDGDTDALTPSASPVEDSVSGAYKGQWLGTKGALLDYAGFAGRAAGIKGLQEWGEEGAAQAGAERAKVQGPSTSFMDVWEEAPGATWGGFATNAIGQIGEVLTEGLVTAAAAAGVGAVVGGGVASPVTAPAGAALGFAGGVARALVATPVLKQLFARSLAANTAKIVGTEAGKKLTVDQVRELATKETLKHAAIGATMYGGLGVAQETGSIYGEAREIEANGGPAVDMGAVAGWGFGAGLAEGVADKLGVDRMFRVGKSASRVANAARGGVSQMVTEGGTEGVQKILEGFGSGKWSLADHFTNPDARRELIDAIASGGVIGHGVGTIGGAVQTPNRPTPADPLSQLPQEELPPPPAPHPEQGGIDQLRGYGIDAKLPTDEDRKAAADKEGAAWLAQLTGQTPLREPERQVLQELATQGFFDDAPPTEAEQKAGVARGITEMTPPGNLFQQAVQGGSTRVHDVIGKARAETADIAAEAAARTARGAPGEARRAAREQAAALKAPTPPDALTVMEPPAPLVPGVAHPVSQQAPQTTPEPATDIAAQVAAMVDPNNPKDSVFVAKGTKPPKTPKGVIKVVKPKQGIFLTTNREKANAIKGPTPLTDEQVAAFLGIPETKQEAFAQTTEPAAVQAKDAQGNVVAEAVTSGAGPNEAAVAAQTPPGGTTQVVSPEQVQEERAAKVERPTSEIASVKANTVKLKDGHSYDIAQDKKGVWSVAGKHTQDGKPMMLGRERAGALEGVPAAVTYGKLRSNEELAGKPPAPSATATTKAKTPEVQAATAPDVTPAVVAAPPKKKKQTVGEKLVEKEAEQKKKAKPKDETRLEKFIASLPKADRGVEYNGKVYRASGEETHIDAVKRAAADNGGDLDASKLRTGLILPNGKFITHEQHESGAFGAFRDNTDGISKALAERAMEAQTKVEDDAQPKPLFPGDEGYVAPEGEKKQTVGEKLIAKEKKRKAKKTAEPVLGVPEKEQPKPKKHKKGDNNWMPKVAEETANDVVSFDGTDENDLPVRLEVRMSEGKVIDARFVSPDENVKDVGIKLKKNDTVLQVVGRMESSGAFTREGNEGKKLEEAPPPAKVYPKGTTQQTVEKDSAIRKLAKGISRLARKKVKPEIDIDAAGDVRQAWVNNKLKGDFGLDDPVRLVQPPPKHVEMVKAMRRLFGRKVQFFVANHSDVDKVLDGFVLPGDPDTIYVNVSNDANPKKTPLMFVLGHEFAHTLRMTNPLLFARFMRDVPKAVLKKYELGEYTKNLNKQYYRQFPDYRAEELGAAVQEETSSDIVASAFMDPDFWELLSRSAKPESAHVIARVMTELRSFLSSILAEARILAEKFADTVTRNPDARKNIIAARMKQAETHRMSAMISDVRQLNIHVRDLLQSAFPDFGQPLTSEQVAKQAADYYTEKMEPEIPWDQVPKDLQADWIADYDLYLSGEISAEDTLYEGMPNPGLISGYNKLTSDARTELGLTEALVKEQARKLKALTREVQKHFDLGYAPKKFSDLTKHWQDRLVRAYRAEVNEEKSESFQKAVEAALGSKSVMKEWAKKEGDVVRKRRATEVAARRAQAERKAESDRLVAEQRARWKAEEETKAAEARNDALSAVLDEAAVAADMLTPSEKQKVATALGYKRWNKSAHADFIEVMAEALATPAAPYGKVPDGIKSVVRRLLKQAPTDTKFSLRVSQIATEAFRKWFGNSKMTKAATLDKNDIEELRHLMEKEDNGETLTTNERKHLRDLKIAFVSRDDPAVWYHATDQDIEAFETGVGDAIYVTQDADFANRFLERGQNYDPDERLDPGKPKSIYPVFVRAENPWDYESSAHRKVVLDALRDNAKFLKALDDHNETFADFEQNLKDGLFSTIEHHAVQKAIRNAGHDSFFVHESGHKNLGVYKPNQLKSAYGNTGAFSTTDDRIRYSLKNQGQSPKGYSRHVAPVTEVYAIKGKEVVGMASYNGADKVWSVWKSTTDIRNQPGLPETRVAKTEDALNALRGDGIRLIRRKDSPVTEGRDAPYGRGPDVLALEIDNDPKPGTNLFTKAVDAAVKGVNLVSGANYEAPKLRRKFTRWVANSYVDVKTLQAFIKSKGGVITGAADLYRHIVLHPGATGAVMSLFERKYSDPMEEAVHSMVKNGGKLEDANNYLIARHAKERNDVIKGRTGKDAGSGMSDKTAEDTLADMATKPFYKDLQEIGKLTDEIAKFKRETMRKGGLISQETHDAMAQYEHYVPLKGLDEDDTGEIARGFGAGTGTGFSGKGTILQYALGRSEGNLATNVISHALLDAEAQIVRAGKNKVANAMEQLAEDFPDPKFWTVAEVKSRLRFDPESGTIKMQADNGTFANNIVISYRDGVPTQITLKQPDFADAMVKSGAAAESGLIDMMRKFNGWQSQMMTTFSPIWALVNGVRDFGGATFNILSDSTLPKGMAAEVVKNIKALHMSGDVWRVMRDPDSKSDIANAYREMESRGAITHFYAVTSLADRARRLAKIEANRLGADAGSKVRTGLHDVWKSARGPYVAELMKDMGATVESVPRLAAYMFLTKPEDKGGAGWDKDRAAEYVKNLTVNFNMKGNQKVFTAGFVFFNAATQSSVRLYQAMTSDRGKKVGMALLTMGFIAGLTGNSAGDDDDDGTPDYQQLGDWERSTNLVLWPNGPKVPLPYGWNAFYATGNFMADTLFGQTPTQAAWKASKAALAAFDPLGSPDSQSMANFIIKQASPSILEPIVMDSMNENFFGGAIRNDPRPGSFKPDSESGKIGVGATWKTLARGLNKLTQGSATEAGGIDVNPNTFDHYFKSYLPGWPQEVIKTADTAEDAIQGRRWNSRTAPGVSRVWSKPTEVNYEALKEAKDRMERIDALTKGDAEDRATLSRYPRWGSVKAVFDTNRQAITQLYKEKAAVVDGKPWNGYTRKGVEAVKREEEIDDAISKHNRRMTKFYQENTKDWPR